MKWPIYRQARWIESERDAFQTLLAKQTPRCARPTVTCLFEAIHADFSDSAVNVVALRNRCRITKHGKVIRFRKRAGMSVRPYLELIRLTTAMRLLGNPAIDIVLIGHEVGYSSYRSFARAFKRRIGCTAGEYRERMASILHK